MDFTVEVALNNLSFGQVSINILFEWYKQGLQPSIFPIGQINLACYNWIDSDFKSWLESCIVKASKSFKRSNPSFKLWHLNGGYNKISDKQVLMTFHETDALTASEINITSNIDRVIVTTDYCKNIFNQFGCNNVSKVNLGFDTKSFKKLDKRYYKEDVISFGLTGKLEYRKRHLDVIKYWAEKYGNNHNYVLNCCVFNQFLSPEIHNNLLSQAFQGKQYWNINFNPFLDRNDAFNDYLNSNSIILGMSAGEGFDLPVFQSIGLGKHAVILNAHAYKEYANNENAVLVNPNGKADCYDQMFFVKGQEFNQGQMFTWSKEDFYTGLDQAVARYRSNKINNAGLKLQSEFTWEKTANGILNELKLLV